MNQNDYFSEENLYQIAVSIPNHTEIHEPLIYKSSKNLEIGDLVKVNFGLGNGKNILGLVWSKDKKELSPRIKIKEILEILPIPKFSQNWLDLIKFTSNYYHYSLGQIAIETALPALLKKISYEKLEKLNYEIKEENKKLKEIKKTKEIKNNKLPKLSLEQEQVIKEISKSKNYSKPFLLFGSPGSGKTEIYLRIAQKVLEKNGINQVLILVPEINLTPQLMARFKKRFTEISEIVVIHGKLDSQKRLKNWFLAHLGKARIILGTRSAIWTSLPNLKLIVIDEEHDPSYKQDDNVRYSARDLAIWRAKNTNSKIILGSATPSLESWYASQTGKYQLLEMPTRINKAELPKVKIIDMKIERKEKKNFSIFSNYVIEAIKERIQRGEQSLIFLNRRGFSQMLFCWECKWKSNCPNCSSQQVFHKVNHKLICHHCGFTSKIPKFCPTCGNPDILSFGNGTQKIEEELLNLLNDEERKVKILRIDADTTKKKGSLEKYLEQINKDEINVLIGTQMITKGHDFRKITLVVAIEPDQSLLSSNFRASERLFTLLMQSSGRAGRDANFILTQNTNSEMLIQTFFPENLIYQSLRNHNFVDFARQQLKERQESGMPPFSFQVILRADAKTQEESQGFLQSVVEIVENEKSTFEKFQEKVFLYSPVPLTIQRINNVERSQLLIESQERQSLQRFLHVLLPWLRWLNSHKKHKNLIRWLVDVDPLNL